METVLDLDRFELSTLHLSGVCSNQLNYRSIIFKERLIKRSSKNQLAFYSFDSQGLLKLKTRNS